jgi:ATP-dependent HslUV protease subunit HslV
MSDDNDKARHGLAPWHGTTILLVRKGNDVVLAGDGQFERLEGKLEKHPGQLARACVELAKDWRQDKYLRRLEAMMAVADKQSSFVLTGSGDVLEPEDGLIGIGSGGSFALAAARALIDIDGMTAEQVAKKAMKIAADICIYTNHNVIFEKL